MDMMRCLPPSPPLLQCIPFLDHRHRKGYCCAAAPLPSLNSPLATLLRVALSLMQCPHFTGDFRGRNVPPSLTFSGPAGRRAHQHSGAERPNAVDRSPGQSTAAVSPVASRPDHHLPITKHVSNLLTSRAPFPAVCRGREQHDCDGAAN
jgi:hypothetical protein